MLVDADAIMRISADFPRHHFIEAPALMPSITLVALMPPTDAFLMAFPSLLQFY